jgi:hypothetical protein
VVLSSSRPTERLPTNSLEWSGLFDRLAAIRASIDVCREIVGMSKPAGSRSETACVCDTTIGPHAAAYPYHKALLSWLGFPLLDPNVFVNVKGL